MPIRLLLLAITMSLTAPGTGAAAGQARDRAMGPYRAGLEDLRAERWAEAAAAFERATEIDPTFEMAYYALGRANMPQRKYAEAARALTRCRDLYLAEAGKAFSNSHEAQQRRRDRITHVDDLIRQFQSGPQSMQTAETLRQLRETRRQLQDSVQRGSAISIETSVPPYVSMALGSALFRLGRMADAEREYKATIAADPKTGEAHNNLAVVYLQTGRFDLANSALQAAKNTGFRVNPELEKAIREKAK